MAKNRRGRSVNGILVLAKPGVLSSNAALQSAKRMYAAAKAGHTGSLDPLATGVLPICFGEATKFSQYLLDSDKVYRSTFLLGTTTDSGDADGKVIQQIDASGITEALILAALPQFEGLIEQVPSMFSALKHNGQPLYKLARQGKTIDRKSRQVTVFDIHIENFRPANGADTGPEVDVYIHCSKGTYVRSIAEDLGAALGCGAHVKSLHRVKAGPFDQIDSVSLDTLQQMLGGESSIELAFNKMDALLKPVDSALMHLPVALLDDSAVHYLLQGQAVQPIERPADIDYNGSIRLMSLSEHFLGIGELLDDGRVSPKRLISTDQSSIQ